MTAVPLVVAATALIVSAVQAGVEGRAAAEDVRLRFVDPENYHTLACPKSVPVRLAWKRELGYVTGARRSRCRRI